MKWCVQRTVKARTLPTALIVFNLLAYCQTIVMSCEHFGQGPTGQAEQTPPGWNEGCSEIGGLGR